MSQQYHKNWVMKLISCMCLDINRSSEFNQAFQMGNDQAHLGMPKWMGSVTKMGWVMNLFFFCMRLFIHRSKKVIQMQFIWVQWGMFKHVWCFGLKVEKLNPQLRKFNFEQCCQFPINTVFNGGILDLLFDKKCSEPASWVLFLYSDCFIVFFIPWTHQYALDQPCLTCCTWK